MAYQQYRRQTEAALPFRPLSSSETSKSRYFERFGLLHYKQYDGPPSKYNLQPLTSSKQVPCSSRVAEGEVADWLVKKLDISSRRVMTTQALKLTLCVYMYLYCVTIVIPKCCVSKKLLP